MAVVYRLGTGVKESSSYCRRRRRRRRYRCHHGEIACSERTASISSEPLILDALSDQGQRRYLPKVVKERPRVAKET